MYLKPQQKKYRKEFKGNLKKNYNEKISFGSFAIVAKTSGRITSKQIEASRRVISKRIKGFGKLWIRIFPSIPVTKKPNEVRMGKGKGGVSFWVCNIGPGKILYEIEGINLSLAKELFRVVSFKLPIQVFLKEINKIKNG